MLNTNPGVVSEIFSSKLQRIVSKCIPAIRKTVGYYTKQIIYTRITPGSHVFKKINKTSCIFPIADFINHNTSSTILHQPVIMVISSASTSSK